jgi:hypothetical protein
MGVTNRSWDGCVARYAPATPASEPGVQRDPAPASRDITLPPIRLVDRRRAALPALVRASQRARAIVLALDQGMAEALQGSRRARSSAEALKRTSGRLAGLVQSFKV